MVWTRIFSFKYIIALYDDRCENNDLQLKGKFPQTTMWIAWIESNKQQVLYVALSRWNYARICDITTGQLSIDFIHRISKKNFFFLDINSPVDQFQS